MRYVAWYMLCISSCMLQRVIAYCIAHNFDSDIYEEALDHIWPQCRHARAHARTHAHMAIRMCCSAHADPTMLSATEHTACALYSPR